MNLSTGITRAMAGQIDRVNGNGKTYTAPPVDGYPRQSAPTDGDQS